MNVKVNIADHEFQAQGKKNNPETLSLDEAVEKCRERRPDQAKSDEKAPFMSTESAF